MYFFQQSYGLCDIKVRSETPQVEGDPELLESSSAAGTSRCKGLERCCGPKCPHHDLLRLWEAENLQFVWVCAVTLTLQSSSLFF